VTLFRKNPKSKRNTHDQEVNMNLLSTSSTAGGLGFTLIYIVVICAVMWFLLVRPQKKEQKRLDTMLASLAVGDSVVTTSGFYGVVIDLTDEDVIVEFGSNKNCRIPMKKSAIAEVEKAEESK
jgi:preprotein translocase subunit YajC